MTAERQESKHTDNLAISGDRAPQKVLVENSMLDASVDLHGVDKILGLVKIMVIRFREMEGLDAVGLDFFEDVGHGEWNLDSVAWEAQKLKGWRCWFYDLTEDREDELAIFHTFFVESKKSLTSSRL